MPQEMVLLTYTPRELDEDQYAEFIRGIDYPAFRQNRHILDYTCWRVIESVQGSEMFTHFDLMKIDSRENWASILADPAVQGNIERWTREWSRHGADHPDPADNLKISFCQMYEG
jgi:hypothetical protein